ncbi:hypothetical protein [Parendozoicomonas haliclonae]|uniref:Uncharacterized protein n=1 Tax=Parendozoicomonas haliclonae TaxID=1960125 RepID=A0A1X7ANG6_9GAMM|nr:hypothetical protein [Parendozoicomonas haliclonae]SMA49638.1 hypothetical protein EHSB41UT_03420 [Parendozoicomonas haliclonae]
MNTSPHGILKKTRPPAVFKPAQPSSFQDSLEANAYWNGIKVSLPEDVVLKKIDESPYDGTFQPAVDRVFSDRARPRHQLSFGTRVSIIDLPGFEGDKCTGLNLKTRKGITEKDPATARKGQLLLALDTIAEATPENFSRQVINIVYIQLKLMDIEMFQSLLEADERFKEEQKSHIRQEVDKQLALLRKAKEQRLDDRRKSHEERQAEFLGKFAESELLQSQASSDSSFSMSSSPNQSGDALTFSFMGDLKESELDTLNISSKENQAD